jgi:hypothetical protein
VPLKPGKDQMMGDEKLKMKQIVLYGRQVRRGVQVNE